MQIRDYDLIYDIDVLFQKKIVIYGAGTYGTRSARLLEDAGVGYDCFCDKNGGETEQHRNHPVITPDRLQEKAGKEDCMIVVGSKEYCEQIIEELEAREINAYVCTWYGLQAGIELHMEDKRFPEKFRKDAVKTRKFWNENKVMGQLGRLTQDLWRFPHPILVYQPAKVGSVTIYRALEREKIDVVHLHRFTPTTKYKSVNEAYRFFASKYRGGVKIITLVRDPVARSLSRFMQQFGEMHVTDNVCSWNLEAEAGRVMTRLLGENEEFLWFDREIKETMGVDVYQYPFDKERGYAWIKQGNIEILLLKTEMLDQNAKVIGEFVGKPDLRLQNRNVGAEKPYKYIYEELKKRIKISSELLDMQYNGNRQLDHFYTEEEKEQFRKKWNEHVMSANLFEDLWQQGAAAINERTRMARDKMQIRDYDFIYDIDVLFRKKIVIYGAGVYGTRSARLLEDAGVGYDCFCDRNGGETEQYRNHPVITPDRLQEKAGKEDCMIVVGSKEYCEQIIEELEAREIDAYVCTWYGLQAGIELHMEDGRFPEKFQKDAVTIRKFWNGNASMELHMRVKWNLSSFPHPILVYQPGKVGSVSIHQTLMREKIDAVYLHCLTPTTDYESVNEAYRFFTSKYREEGVKIITLVRDPVARSLLRFMQQFGEMHVADDVCSWDLEAEAGRIMTEMLGENDEFLWFDREIKEVFGVDVYQYPFDKEQGYAWIKQGNIEILLLKTEMLDQNVKVIGEFVGKPDIRLQNGSVGAEKHYKYIYEELKKRLRIPFELLDTQYNGNRQLDHFYTEDEKEQFRKKWCEHC